MLFLIILRKQSFIFQQKDKNLYPLPLSHPKPDKTTTWNNYKLKRRFYRKSYLSLFISFLLISITSLSSFSPASAATVSTSTINCGTASSGGGLAGLFLCLCLLLCSSA